MLSFEKDSSFRPAKLPHLLYFSSFDNFYIYGVFEYNLFCLIVHWDSGFTAYKRFSQVWLS